MAFSFNAITNALDGKTNIFDPNAGKANPQFGGAKPNDVFQTSTSSGASGAAGAAQVGGGPAAAPTRQAAPPAVNPGLKQKAYAGVGSVDTSKQTGRIAGDIRSANDKLQAEADIYGQKASNEAAGYSLDPFTLEKAADGDAAAMSKTQARLAKSKADPFESFGGLKDEELPSSADALKNKDTYGEIFRPEATPNYGSGESRLQSMLMNRGSGFRAQAASLYGDQENFVKANDKAAIDKTKEANSFLDKAFSDATGEARTKLTGLSDEVTAAAQKKADAENIVRAGLDPKALSETEFKKLAEKLRTEFAGATGATGRSLKYLDDPSNFDLSSYINIDRQTDGSEFLDQAGADRFNRINGLLGNGKLATVSATGPGSQYAFDEAGAAAAIRAQMLGKRATEDQTLQSELDKIQAAATGRAGADQGDALKNAQDYVTRSFLDQNEGQSPQEIQAEQEAYRQLFNPETNWNPYYTQQGGLSAPGSQPRTWQDLLNPQEAARMNELSGQLGTNGDYKAGTAYNTPNYNPQYFDQKFKTTFDRILGEMGGTVPMTSNQGTASNSELGQGLGQDRTVNAITDAQARAKAEADKIAYAKSLRSRLGR